MPVSAAKAVCVLIGYLCGSFLTACFVAKKYTGKSIRYLGPDGNPGMANVMANIGFVPGIIVLAGDILKVVIASVICWILFSDEIGALVFLYAGTGASLGHCFSFWRKFKGGKAVTTICSTMILFSPLWGTLASLIGALVVLLTHYLSIGGVSIPVFFTVFAFAFISPEAGIIGIFNAVLSFSRHYSAMKKDLAGKGKETDLISILRHKKK